ncbi:dTDP-glucose 4,6-dehydratase [Candidatus Falkowbacteria bacterium RIFOXYB2_FULL_47_14]|uniref:dTDP-glucose 4,6-dehydratase n=1 Tax=Candidatus Falkowbacteria bacterium RIFOXYA2_FULL_47_19 TaxID=1797994 RepID=A0A1F5SLI6_9BACT|nr:MAG: dTDP-glucose 4,6-dehydratase [Candidatus Falkowbacteria bacterium RIFOXYA2_FULL_47_19]OGF36659.1 MAG: dTDP-glucose 4,6-dehydratase [Candidatus Falkowbacteria bacterium RIFOXYC2_FULL_46_15]OGF43139.1 MAG: dTDP-glucose 4,6-dehydratase [Candidatus Falkowbacteria bacterium RIFOXYB2_FULL_47_14]
MRLLVTGGAGFIGSNFIRYWLKEYPDDKIVNLDILNYAGNLENLKDAENNPNYKFVKGDICDMGTVAEIMGEVDLIVHFAAESHVDRSIMDSGNFVRVNVEGTRVLLEAAKNAGGKRFHHISTDEVFGHLGPGDPAFNERAPLSPRSPYSASKAGAEHLVRAYFHTHKLPVTISNCSNNYGPYHFPEKLIPLFVTNLLEDKKVPVYGKGENVRDWIHVDDHNRGVDMIIKKGRIGETYCLGGGNEISNLALTRMILRLMDKDEAMIEYVADRPGHDLRYAIDFSKARHELGWEPEIDFEAGLKNTIEWYKKNKEWWQRIRSGAYQEYYNKQYGKQ